MRFSGRFCRVLTVVALAASLVLPMSASATMRTTTVRRQRLTLAEVRKMSAQARTALVEDEEDAATEFVTGTVTFNGGMREDSFVLAAALVYEGGEWWFDGAALVGADGTYRIGLWEPGTYRVGFLDFGNVYKDVFYLDANTPEDAADVTVAQNQTVTGINQTVNPLPETMITGRVGFVGAPAPADGVEIVALQYVHDEYYDEWYWTDVAYAGSKPDGAYRLHLREAGAYKIGFWDWTGAFSPVLYLDAEEPEDATDVVVPDLGTTVAGIDQTMTANPSDVVSGSNRYGTAVDVSKAMFPDTDDEEGFGYGTVVLATGEDWPDALVASSLAGQSWGPLLLTRQGSLPSETLQEILRLNPYEVIIVGGYNAVSLAAEVDLRLGTSVPTIRRITGRDRYETAAMVAQEMASRAEYGGWFEDEEGESGYEWNPIVASGETYADAMSAGPLSAWEGMPILLTRHDSLPPATAGWFRTHEIEDTLLVGGASAVSPAVASLLPRVRRVGGSNRYATACALAAYSEKNFEMSSQLFGVASGENFPDGLVAGPALGMQGRSLLLTRPFEIPGETSAFLRSREGGIAGLRFFGSESAIAPWVVDEMMCSVGLQPLYADEEDFGGP